MRADVQVRPLPGASDVFSDVTTEVGVFRYIEAVATRFRFAGFAIIALSSAEPWSLRRAIVASNWSAAFIEAFDALQPFRNSPLFARLRTSTAPLIWSLDGLRDPAAEQDNARVLFAEAGYLSGVVLPVHSPEGERAAITFEGTRGVVTRSELGELLLEAMLSYDLFCRMKSEPRSEGARLSEREVQVLNWAANGKTSIEIATILSLSDHTVNSYLNSAMRKLDCVNRTQLVAKALRLRIIS